MAAFAALGNKLRHEYQHVDPKLIWNITREQLAELGVAVRMLQSAM